MKILVTGSSGLLGTAAVEHLTASGHFVVRLVRRNPDPGRGDVLWDPVAGRIERAKLETLDAVVHLAGENLFGVWTPRKKQRIHRSRVQATELLAEALAGLTHKPKVIVSASAVGYYGDCGDTWVDEHSPQGAGFLAQTCAEWEQAHEIARHAGIRVASLRFGIILSAKGGALATMLPVFRLGLGGRLGSGRQYMSWVSMHDAVRIIRFAIETPAVHGPVNAVAPDPVTNAEFTRTLGRVLHRTAFFHVPSFSLRLLPGGMGREMFLSSARVKPERLRETGFRFEHPEIEEALRHALT